MSTRFPAVHGIADTPPGGESVSKRFKDNEREEVINIRTHSNSVNAPQDVRTVRNDIRTNNPRLRTIHDPSIRNALVTHSRSTR